jgi:hypothetical protein
MEVTHADVAMRPFQGGAASVDDGVVGLVDSQCGIVGAQEL